MNVALKAEFERFVEDQVRAGKYPTAEEVVGAGLELLRQRQATLLGIRSKITEGMDQANRGELLDGEQVFNEVFGAVDNGNGV